MASTPVEVHALLCVCVLRGCAGVSVVRVLSLSARTLYFCVCASVRSWLFVGCKMIDEVGDVAD